uniref:TPX2_importin domain-containing protein n=1 Tax=Rhabditophanes sp. KR3021 TaxID=114890 RepID=A0AC35U3H6_9BILA
MQPYTEGETRIVKDDEIEVAKDGDVQVAEIQVTNGHEMDSEDEVNSCGVPKSFFCCGLFGKPHSSPSLSDKYLFLRNFICNKISPLEQYASTREDNVLATTKSSEMTRVVSPNNHIEIPLVKLSTLSQVPISKVYFDVATLGSAENALPQARCSEVGVTALAPSESTLPQETSSAMYVDENTLVPAENAFPRVTCFNMSHVETTLAFGKNAFRKSRGIPNVPKLAFSFNSPSPVKRKNIHPSELHNVQHLSRREHFQKVQMEKKEMMKKEMEEIQPKKNQMED